MASVRIYARQIAKFAPGTGRWVIDCAMNRYRAGELNVVRSVRKRSKNAEDVLQPFPIRHRPAVSDALLRDILDAHFATPRPELEREIARLDREIEQMFRKLPRYIIREPRYEDEDEDEDEDEEEEVIYGRV